MNFNSFQPTGGRLAQTMEKAQLSVSFKEIEYFY